MNASEGEFRAGRGYHPSYAYRKDEYTDTILRSVYGRDGTSTIRSSSIPSTLSHNELDYFFFKERRGRYDWKTLATIDVDRVAKEVDLTTLNSVVENITFADVLSEKDHRYIDGEVVKILRLSQLSIEYLMHIQNCLATEKKQCKDEVDEQNRKMLGFQEHIQKLDEEMLLLKKENRRQKKSINVYELLLKLPANVRDAPTGNTSFHPCPYCKKTFSAIQYLQNHVDRRHKDQDSSFMMNSQPPQHFSQSNMYNSRPLGEDSLPSELKTLRENLLQETERLKAAEQEMKNKMDLTMSKQREALRLKEEELDRTQHQQQLKFEEEMRTFQSALRKEFYDQKASLMEQERKMEELRNKVATDVLSIPKPSGLGNTLISDDEGTPLPSAKKSKKDVDSQLTHEMDEMRRENERMREEYNRQLEEVRRKTDMENRRNKRLEEKNQRLEDSNTYLRNQPSKETVKYVERVEEEEPRRKTKPQKVVKPVEEEAVQSLTENYHVEESDSDIDVPLAGSWTPYKRWPFIQTLYNHPPETLQDQKDQVVDALIEQLRSRNLTEGKLSEKQYAEHMKQLQQFRQKYQSDLAEIHSEAAEDLERTAAKYYVKEKQTGGMSVGGVGVGKGQAVRLNNSGRANPARSNSDNVPTRTNSDNIPTRSNSNVSDMEDDSPPSKLGNSQKLGGSQKLGNFQKLGGSQKVGQPVRSGSSRASNANDDDPNDNAVLPPKRKISLVDSQASEDPPKKVSVMRQLSKEAKEESDRREARKVSFPGRESPVANARDDEEVEDLDNSWDSNDGAKESNMEVEDFDD
eukprot:TRINITY_DN9388_c0_g1_i1.p1 TRINITY_DN9388_c0_g1~~TRINITY_DN9388_c0_g1_i1.p1  ORF type:complete len:803 (-),score=228.43 TRINITY_DN9388_c0_g1_i1:49-2457(-)